MSLPYEYFKNKTHIKDLKKLKDDELYCIIQSFYKELDKLNKKDIQLKDIHLKELNKLCDNIKETIKDVRFILNGYIKVYQEKYYNAKERSDIGDI